MTLAAALIRFCLFCSCLIPFSIKGNIAIFSPPEGWNEAISPSSKVKASYILKTKNNFSPSINFTSETTSTSPKEYLSSLEKLYTNHTDYRFRTLGTLNTKSGLAHLTSLDMTTPAGKARILQSIFFQDGTAYILTAAIPLESFGTHQKEIFQSFCSLTFVNTLEEYIQNSSQKELFLQKLNEDSSSNDISSLRQFIAKQFPKEGLHWQSLAIEELAKKVTQNSKGK